MERKKKAAWWKGKSCRLASMLSLTSSFCILELVFGYWTNSMALVADSFHMLSDVLALTIAFFSVRISKQRTRKNTFGWARAEVLGALVNSVFLCALCFSIFIEALKRLVHYELVHEPVKILIVGCIGLVINILGLALFHGHVSSEHHCHPIRAGEDKKLEQLARDAGLTSNEILPHSETQRQSISPPPEQVTSEDTLLNGEPVTVKTTDAKEPGKKGRGSSQLNMRAAFLHVMGDALGSVVVIISALIMWLTEWEYKLYVDPVMSLFLVTIILCTTAPVIRESALILLQTVPTHIEVDKLKKKLLKSFPEIISLHEFHVWQLAGNKIIASTHIRCNSLTDYMLLAKRIKEFFHDEGIHSTTVQPEFADLLLGERSNVVSSSEIAIFDDSKSSGHGSACVVVCPPGQECSKAMCCTPKRSASEVHADGN